MGPETSQLPTRRRGLVLSAIAIALALLIGIVVGRSLAPEEDVAQPESPAPARTEDGTDYAQSEAGAVRAATDFAQVVAAASEDKEAYRESIRRLADPRWVSDAEDVADNTLEFLDERYGLEGSFSFVPAKYRVADFSREEATIQIWGVTLSTGPKINGIEETWITGTVELAWTTDGWRVSGQESATGPTPELLQAQDDLGGNELAGFEEYIDGPTP